MLLKYVFRNLKNGSFQSRGENPPSGKTGEIRVDHIPPQKTKTEGGEYIDYEEVRGQTEKPD